MKKRYHQFLCMHCIFFTLSQVTLVLFVSRLFFSSLLLLSNIGHRISIELKTSLWSITKEKSFFRLHSLWMFSTFRNTSFYNFFVIKIFSISIDLNTGESNEKSRNKGDFSNEI